MSEQKITFENTAAAFSRKITQKSKDFVLRVAKWLKTAHFMTSIKNERKEIMGNWEKFKEAEKKLHDTKEKIDKYDKAHNDLLQEKALVEEKLQKVEKDIAKLEGTKAAIDKLKKEYDKILVEYDKAEGELIRETLSE